MWYFLLYEDKKGVIVVSKKLFLKGSWLMCIRLESKQHFSWVAIASDEVLELFCDMIHVLMFSNDKYWKLSDLMDNIMQIKKKAT